MQSPFSSSVTARSRPYIQLNPQSAALDRNAGPALPFARSVSSQPYAKIEPVSPTPGRDRAMKAVALSAAAIALVGVAASAQETGQQPSAPQSTTPPQPVAVPASSTAESRWIESATGQSSLLTQLNAVVRAQSAALLAEAGRSENTVQITTAMSDAIAASENNCRQMPSPGSRIHTERCFNETEAEKRLNQYQFDEELRFSRQEAARQQLEQGHRAAERAMGGSRAAGGVPR